MTNNKKVLALKYRPQTFQDLIGQDVVVETISNSIKVNKLPNAYLFTGIRGIGKTTTARLVARALNCSNGIENICKEELCINCDSISKSNHIDVLEMDAASKTGVDDVRDLIEFSRYGPTSAKFKIFIIDEVHMLSKQAFNALLKTLEEPPEYLKFIFATTEIKKIPITVVSRCQRFDLSRIKSFELFNFIKEILEKENRKASEDAIKLIVKISEGSVRDALSLLDRALMSQDKNIELDLKTVQKIFGYFDKSHLIELFENVFQGNEKKVLQIYRNIYDQGIEPKIFLNDFLEILYYFKNISSLKIDGTNFTLNDTEFNSIQKISKNINNETLLLFWQFTIKTIEEIEIVSNQNIAMEMFLIRLMYLKGISNFSNILENHKNLDETNINSSHKNNTIDNKTNDSLTEIKGNTVGQIKNVIQKKNLQEPILESSEKIHLEIKTFSDLINLCNSKKEIKLKYELETNVNLVSFNDKRIEISFNEKLDKEFIKTLSSKLFDWTNDRWIISLSKEMGDLSKKEKDIILKKESLEVAKKGKVYKKVLEIFNDAELIGINIATTEVKKND